MQTSLDSLVSPALRGLFELFEADLADVKFPDLDLGVLRAEEKRVQTLGAELARAEAAAESARTALNDAQEILLLKGQRALAYLRVYAEDDGELSAKLDQISLPRAPRKGLRTDTRVAPGVDLPSDAAPKRRGRPAKSRNTDSLFTQAPIDSDLSTSVLG